MQREAASKPVSPEGVLLYQPPMKTVLIADIGATNSRFALVGPNGRPEHMIKFRGDDVASLEDGITRYLDEVGRTAEAAVIAVAAPVEGDSVTMTNRDWSFRLSGLATRFGWKAVRGINDFEAVAWALERLTPADIHPVGAAPGRAGGMRVVFGPGTGLGVAALAPTERGFQAIPTEGGHVTFGPASDEEEPVFNRLRKAHGPVSAEMILSGPGLVRLHHALHQTDLPVMPADIVGGAHRGENAPLATVMLFVRLFGRFAGDLALTFRAVGGVYIGGGVARRIGALLDAGVFRAAFEQHPPYGWMLERIPTTLITYDEPGLLGCAELAAHLMDGEDLTAR